MRRAARPAAVALAGAAVLLAGCTAPPEATRPITSAPVSAASPSAGPDDDVAALQATVTQINDAADTPEQQRTVLDRLAADEFAQQQRQCSPATTTITLEPAWSQLRTLGDGRYALPSLIRVHQADRITGTDVTVLVMRVTDGRGRTSVLCVA